MAVYELDGQAPELPSSGNYFVAETAVVIGRVRLREAASVWFGAVLRGDNEWIEVGEGSNVQDNCTCHTDLGFPLVIGTGCTIGHNVILHGCTIEDGALVGMGSVVMNGVRIGRGSIVGAGSVITEGISVKASIFFCWAQAVKPCSSRISIRKENGLMYDSFSS